MTATPHPWKVVIIVEDDSDGRAIKEMLARRQPSLLLDWLPAGGIGEIKRKGPELIKLAWARITGARGCVAVIVDGDGKDPAKDEPHRSIQQHCAGGSTEFLICREALEAWLLADPGCCAWLNLRIPVRSDTMADPKGHVSAAFYKKTGRTYQRRRARLEVARQATGPDIRRNESLEIACLAVDGCAEGRRLRLGQQASRRRRLPVGDSLSAADG